MGAGCKLGLHSGRRERASQRGLLERGFSEPGSLEVTGGSRLLPSIPPSGRGCPASPEALPTSSSASVVFAGRAWQVARAWGRWGWDLAEAVLGAAGCVRPPWTLGLGASQACSGELSPLQGPGLRAVSWEAGVLCPVRLSRGWGRPGPPGLSLLVGSLGTAWLPALCHRGSRSTSYAVRRSVRDTSPVLSGASFPAHLCV